MLPGSLDHNVELLRRMLEEERNDEDEAKTMPYTPILLPFRRPLATTGLDILIGHLVLRLADTFLLNLLAVLL